MKNQKKKNLFKTLGVGLLCGVVSASTLVACAPQEASTLNDVNVPGVETVIQSNSNLGLNVISREPNKLKLFSSDPVVVQEENNVYVEQTVTATVLPLDSPYQDVTWELSWETENEENVLDYVTITPSEKDSKVLTLRCYKAFPDKDMRLVCKTNVGGFSAYASVSYYGMPTSFYLGHRPPAQQNEGLGITYYEIESGSTYETEIFPQNVLGSVNADYQPEYNVTITAHGKIGPVGLGGTTNMQGLNNIKSVSLGDIEFDLTSGLFFFNVSDVEHDLAKFSVVGNKLKIEALSSLEERLELINKVGVKFEETHFAYFTLTVKDIKANISKNYSFRIVCPVESVSLDSSEVVF